MLRAAFFTKEYPPAIYGGAGVHVDHLSRALARRIEVEVRCFGDQDLADGNLKVRGYPAWEQAAQGTDPRFAPVLDSAARGLAMARDRLEASVVHCHTWYTHLAGLLARQLWQIPLLVTTHSLEPLRPWKREQLGSGYELSSWFERTALESADAVIAVSQVMRGDILRLFRVPPERVHVVPNGVDTGLYRRTSARDALERRGISSGSPYVLFVGRISRQKGIQHLLRAVERLAPDIHAVFCAGSADTVEVGNEVRAQVAALRERRPGLHWIEEMVPVEEMLQLYSHAAVFCCPSVYEPFGIINLEAMACELPVVASAVGGIPEVVVHGETGILIDPGIPPGGTEPADAEAYAAALARSMQALIDDPAEAARLGAAGRRRAEVSFSWDSVAERTIALYRSLGG